MEETHFIKCEPAWSEESSNSESHVPSAIGDLPEVKPDPDGSWEEVKSTLVIKEESGTLVVSREDCDDAGDLLHESLLVNLAGPLSSTVDPPTLNDQQESSQIHCETVSQSSVNTHGEERFCACGKIFASCRHSNLALLEPTRKKNVDKSSSADKKAFSCPVCERAYTYKSDYDMHMRTHTGHKPHTCPTCGKAFSRRFNMKQHMLLHTGDRPYSCSTCGKTFTKRGHLSEHVLVHTGEKPHVCEICGRRFTQRATLRNHRLLHAGSYPYKCDMCERAFNYKSRLNKHILSHVGVETQL